MNVQRWIARRETNWKRLDVLLQKVEKKGLKTLAASEIKELASLYRSVSADLARARSNKAANILTQDLQKLTSRAYSQIYQGKRDREWRQIWEFYLWGFPQVVQDTWIYIAVAFAIFFISAIVAWWYAWFDPSFMSLIVPEGLIEKVRDKGELWMGSIVGTEPLASSSIMTNNLGVCFRAVGGGITAGFFTVFLLINNGLLMGAIGALVGQNNLAYPFWGFVLPHGSLELPAIFFAGGAGLLIGKAILFPGRYLRIDALKINGLKAAQLVFGIVPMLVIAGTIEGFFSPSPIVPDPVKYLVGIVLLILLVMYCSLKKQS
jgi:uncharacterized membrane protein SpoIIM required for sporulation